MIHEIINLPDHKLKNHIDLLAIDYKEKTGRTVCKSCPSDLQQMVLTLKKIYNMTQFELKKPFVIYKLQKHNPQTISNDKMTDELAIAFLKINPDRIELFGKYPDNWKELIGDESNVSTEKKPCNDCKKKSKLLNTNMNDLREQYPTIKATSKKDFVDQILTLKNEDL